MFRIAKRSGAAAALAAVACLSVAAPARADQVPCGNPDDAKVYLRSMGGTPLCFTKAGTNPFNKVGVERVESGAWTVVVRLRDQSVTVPVGSTRYFAQPVNPLSIDLRPF
ncbi:hypothetical protein [Actinoplanes teichomyceticus]|uniref:Beta/gamma crystallin n=1 Tax=Actinoplanes teichomyceticus TaxID=1867 RepID=A0A561VR08_ACTTI|nr:hypothetical protein [Actinoplanes teichomyceticus]TWG14031.1 hypothetical protein FHX34_104325 [Actinoplanes teichomyceticus]